MTSPAVGFFIVVLPLAFLTACGSGDKPQRKPQALKTVEPAAANEAASPVAEGYELEWKSSISLANKQRDLESKVKQALNKKLAPLNAVALKDTQPAQVVGKITIRCSAQWDAYGSGPQPTIVDEESAVVATNKLPRKLVLTIKVATAAGGSSWDGEHTLAAEHQNPEKIETTGPGAFFNLEAQSLKALVEKLEQQIEALPAYTRPGGEKPAKSQ